MSKSNYLKQNITAKQARQQADLDAIVAELLETYGIGGPEEKARLEKTIGRPIPAGDPSDPPEPIEHGPLEVTWTHTGDVSGGFRHGTDYQEIYRFSGLIPPGENGEPDIAHTLPVCQASSDTLRAELRMRDETRPALKTPLSSAAKILRRDAEEIADRIYAEFGCDAGCGMPGIVQIVEEVLGRFPGRTTCYRPEDLEGQCWVDILPRAPTQALVDETAGRAKTPEQYAALAPARMEPLEHDRAAFYCFKPTDAFSRNDMLRWVEECRWPGYVTLTLIPEEEPGPRTEPERIKPNCPCEYLPVEEPSGTAAALETSPTPLEPIQVRWSDDEIRRIVTDEIARQRMMALAARPLETEQERRVRAILRDEIRDSPHVVSANEAGRIARQVAQEEIHIALTRAATNARPASHRTVVIKERNP